ncbi:MAG: ribonuclease P protein component 1 [Candidatus Bathyarchaeota archaeon]|nr:MAG: ribonuclease P protein component 1 [Candidatus Bathyarchaeota archaeon]
MKPTPSILQHEFIGLNAKVVQSSHPNYVGIEGQVINETRNTIVIAHRNKNKKIVKNTAVFHFTTPNGTVVEINGKTIVGRPEDRIKKKLRRRW